MCSVYHVFIIGGGGTTMCMRGEEVGEEEDADEEYEYEYLVSSEARNRVLLVVVVCCVTLYAVIIQFWYTLHSILSFRMKCEYYSKHLLFVVWCGVLRSTKYARWYYVLVKWSLTHTQTLYSILYLQFFLLLSSNFDVFLYCKIFCCAFVSNNFSLSLAT